MKKLKELKDVLTKFVDYKEITEEEKSEIETAIEEFNSTGEAVFKKANQETKEKILRVIEETATIVDELNANFDTLNVKKIKLSNSNRRINWS